MKSNPTYISWNYSSLLSTFHEAFSRDALSPFCYMNVLLVQIRSVFFKSQMLVDAIVLCVFHVRFYNYSNILKLQGHDV